MESLTSALSLQDNERKTVPTGVLYISADRADGSLTSEAAAMLSLEDDGGDVKIWLVTRRVLMVPSFHQAGLTTSSWYDSHRPPDTFSSGIPHSG